MKPLRRRRAAGIHSAGARLRLSIRDGSDLNREKRAKGKGNKEREFGFHIVSRDFVKRGPICCPKWPA